MNFKLNLFSHKIYLLIFLLLLLYHFHREFIINKYFNSKNEICEKSQSKKLKIVNKLNEVFSKLLLNIRNEIHINSNYSEKNNFENNQNKIMLCSIGKEENLYAKEFVEYYLSLGFDKIIIMDNNDLNGERFDDILKSFIEKIKVEIKDLRGLKQIQLPSFNYCYMKYKYFYMIGLLFLTLMNFYTSKITLILKIIYIARNLTNANKYCSTGIYIMTIIW